MRYRQEMKWCLETVENVADAVSKDQHLLTQCEKGEIGPLLRLWESQQVGVVLGKGNVANREVNIAQCKLDQIPIVRRSSGGGAVVIGPGCLCYSLMLPISYHEKLKTINGTNAWIMQKMARGLSIYFDVPIQVQGYTDLSLNTQKISGNSQRRLRHALLFHGTILYQFDLDLITTYLNYPTRTPDYRNHRSHVDFITQLLVDSQQQLVDAVVSIWHAK